jgi:hypothetical protein
MRLVAGQRLLTVFRAIPNRRAITAIGICWPDAAGGSLPSPPRSTPPDHQEMVKFSRNYLISVQTAATIGGAERNYAGRRS